MWTIALAGNPNAGKTTLFNALTGANAYVGNWPGVTVEQRRGRMKLDEEMELVDLPGVYSLSPYSPEEAVTRHYLMEGKPDAVINIVDGANLERNLYLTTELLELGIPMVLACNRADVLFHRGEELSPERMERTLGVPVVMISALKDEGIDALVRVVRDVAEGEKKPSFDAPFVADWQASEDAPARSSAERSGRIAPAPPRHATEEENAKARYDYLAKIVPTFFIKKKAEEVSLTDRLDRWVTHPVLAFPIFLVLMTLMYWLAVSPNGIGTRGTDFINDVVVAKWVQGGLSTFFTNIGVSEWLRSLVVDGMVGGVGAVIGFLPQMIVLFLCLGLLELSGYMARVALILDRAFHHFGLSGKSFIPLLIGTGCTVPGILATRTIEDDRERRMTIITNSFMPCGAKLPIIAFIGGAFFPDRWWFAPLFYVIGVGLVAFSGLVLKKFQRFQGEARPFFIELPDYHLPTLESLFRVTWFRVRSFVIKAGTVILFSSIVLWVLMNLGWENGSLGLVEEISNSFMARLGKVLSFAFVPLGFGNWPSVTASIGGLVAKENLMSTFGVIFSMEGDVLELVEQGGASGLTQITSLYTPLAAFSFLLFNLYTLPCISAVGAMKQELGSRSWFTFGILYLLSISYSASLIVYQGGLLLQGEPITMYTIFAGAVLALWLYLILRRPEGPKAEKKGNVISYKG